MTQVFTRTVRGGNGVRAPLEEPQPTEADSNNAPAAEPPVKKRRITGKQKYQSITARTAQLKLAVSNDWLKHAEASSRPTVTRSATRRLHYASNNHHTFVVNEQRNPKTVAAVVLPATDANKIHKSHHRMLLRDITFCKHCGYNSSRKPQKLKEGCPLGPKHNNVAQQLRRMLKGFHPNSKLEFWPGGLSTLEKCPPINIDGA
jgi:hypothetical protein